MDPRAADLSPFSDLIARLEAEGMRFVTFTKAATDPDFWSKMTNLQNDVLRDWPDPDPNPDFEPMREAEAHRFFDQCLMILDASFIAIANGELVGYTGLGGANREAGRIESGPTAVRTDFRGRGVATALKVLAVREARRLGFTRARAQSANPAMIRVGEKLGFVPGAAEVRLLLDSAPSGA
jgi:mycothiol synthase